jgi:hypothetical protein
VLPPRGDLGTNYANWSLRKKYANSTHRFSDSDSRQYQTSGSTLAHHLRTRLRTSTPVNLHHVDPSHPRPRRCRFCVETSPPRLGAAKSWQA